MIKRKDLKNVIFAHQLKLMFTHPRIKILDINVRNVKRHLVKTIIHFSIEQKKDKYSKFLEFIDLFIIGTTLEQCANKLKITLKTAFFWRHKFLCLISSYYEHSLKKSKLSNLIQIDEKYGTVCRKGRKKVNNPRKRGYSTSYSTELKKRGLSRDKYCLCTSVDENDKYSFKILGFGKPSKKSLIQYAKQNFNLNNSQIICDGDKVYYGVCYDLNIPFSIANSFKFPHNNDRNLNIQKINALHSKIERNKISNKNTCYIYRYLWFEIWTIKQNFEELKNDLMRMIKNSNEDWSIKSYSRKFYWENPSR